MLLLSAINKFRVRYFCFYIFCIGALAVFSSCGIFNRHSATVFNKSVSHAPFDVVIVPGIPYDTANANPMFKARMLWAKELYDRGIARHIIFSGSAVHSPYVEGMIMKMMADSMGIPTRHTFVEDKALHTNENIIYGIKLAHSMCFRNIAIATDPIQAMLIKKHVRNGMGQVHVLPFSMQSMSVYYKTTLPQIPVSDAFVENFIPLKARAQEETTVVD